MLWTKIDFNPKITIVPIVSPCVWAIVLVCMLVGSRMLRITGAHAGRNQCCFRYIFAKCAAMLFQNNRRTHPRGQEPCFRYIVAKCAAILFQITDAHILAGRNPY